MPLTPTYTQADHALPLSGQARSRRSLWSWPPMLMALVVVIAYAGLLPAGSWSGDDYFVSWQVAHLGWDVVPARIFGGSPRPIAEVLTWLYLTGANALQRPAVGSFLLILWLAAIGSIAIAGYVGRVRQPWLLAMLIFALTLLLIKPGEMFYWPQGAAAYMPCWAGLAAATVLHRTDLAAHSRALMLSLLVAAFSAEVGAVTVLLYAGLSVVAGPNGSFRRLLLPALGCGLVCLLLLRSRLGATAEVMAPASGLAGTWLGSLRAALPTFAGDMLGISGLPLMVGVAVKLALVFSLPAHSNGTLRPTLLWVAALLLGAFSSIVFAYHQFGSLCCERHATLRQGMVLLALLALAGLLKTMLLHGRSILLTVLILGLVSLRAVPLWAAWESMPEARLAHWRTWQSAGTPGETMTLFLAHTSPIVNDDELPAGHYKRSTDNSPGDTPWFAFGVMARFGKHILDIEPASH